jgi:predicted small lipoprotein YifL
MEAPRNRGSRLRPSICYGAPDSGAKSVTRTRHLFIRVATLGAVALALGLAGCGRKGPLDLPPSASVAEPAAAAPEKPGAMSMNPMSSPAKRDEPDAFSATGAPVAPQGQKKPLFLDWLID